jgi:hypothetical protein
MKGKFGGYQCVQARDGVLGKIYLTDRWYICTVPRETVLEVSHDGMECPEVEFDVQIVNGVELVVSLAEVQWWKEEEL